jgi:hypothetical protein
MVSFNSVTFQSNTAGHGGGIENSGALVMKNGLLNGNIVTGSGSGIWNMGGSAVLKQTSVRNNSAYDGGGVNTLGNSLEMLTVNIAGNAIYEDSPQTPANPGILQMVNSVIFDSSVNCAGALFQSLGHNLSQDTCPALNAPTDQENYTGALLVGSLAIHGGAFPMQTILPLSGSPLIDAGGSGDCPATDQRGAPRVGICDLGATEYGAAVYNIHLPMVVR